MEITALENSGSRRSIPPGTRFVWFVGSSVRQPRPMRVSQGLERSPPSPDREHAYEGFQSRGRLFASLSGHQLNDGKALDWTRIKSLPS
jgi:hypothetical protein